ncbi:MAG: response regulator transcription factor [Thermoanaerobaculia bacterium]|nr:response regulator transcription factor [Thermoanaerobaculia bacterium]
MSKRILIIEDNHEIASLVALHLRDAGYETEVAADGESGLAEAGRGGWDLVILDLMLPGVDGLEVCRRLRAADVYTPILMLTAKSGELDRVLGLEIGADDYLTKPFSIRELLARIKALFRRIESLGPPREMAESALEVAGVRIDPLKRTVTVDERRIQLTAKEFDLLHQFARHPGRAYTRAELLDLIWGYGHEGYEHTVNTHINRLRAKIENDPSRPRYIQTVWGVGYKFADLEESDVA